MIYQTLDGAEIQPGLRVLARFFVGDFTVWGTVVPHPSYEKATFDGWFLVDVGWGGVQLFDPAHLSITGDTPDPMAPVVETLDPTPASPITDPMPTIVVPAEVADALTAEILADDHEDPEICPLCNQLHTPDDANCPALWLL